MFFLHRWSVFPTGWGDFLSREWASEHPAAVRRNWRTRTPGSKHRGGGTPAHSPTGILRPHQPVQGDLPIRPRLWANKLKAYEEGELPLCYGFHFHSPHSTPSSQWSPPPPTVNTLSLCLMEPWTPEATSGVRPSLSRAAHTARTSGPPSSSVWTRSLCGSMTRTSWSDMLWPTRWDQSTVSARHLNNFLKTQRIWLNNVKNNKKKKKNKKKMASWSESVDQHP